jgi:hypothetical protein
MNYGGEACDVFTPGISHFCRGSQKVVAATVSKANAPHQPYANPEGARFTAMHGGSWCSFAYEVGSYSFDTRAGVGHFNFSAGGQQCNRPEGSHGPIVIEGVFEELDSAGEFFFNATTRMLTLWYNASSGTPPPVDGSIVVPTLTTVLAARGSQAAPVNDLAIYGVGIRDTAPSIMLPHTGPRFVRDHHLFLQPRLLHITASLAASHCRLSLPPLTAASHCPPPPISID